MSRFMFNKHPRYFFMGGGWLEQEKGNPGQRTEPEPASPGRRGVNQKGLTHDGASPIHSPGGADFRGLAGA